MKADPIAQTLGVIVMEAVRQGDELRANGASRETVLAGIEGVIRQHWPKGRAEDWHLLCDRCVDTGWEVRDCPGDATCGREKRHGAHRYAVACWCAKGKTMLAKPRQEVDELASVGKMPKAAARWGR